MLLLLLRMSKSRCGCSAEWTTSTRLKLCKYCDISNGEQLSNMSGLKWPSIVAGSTTSRALPPELSRSARAHAVTILRGHRTRSIFANLKFFIWILLTISAHSNGDAFLQPAVLASIPVDAQNGTLLVLGAGSILDLLLDAASEETLRRTVSLNTIVTITAWAAIFYTSSVRFVTI